MTRFWNGTSLPEDQEARREAAAHICPRGCQLSAAVAGARRLARGLVLAAGDRAPRRSRHSRGVVELPFTSSRPTWLPSSTRWRISHPTSVCGHSYGGRLISAATGSLATVRHLVYLSVQLLNARQLEQYIRRPRNRNTAIPDLATIRSKYYNECSEQDFLAAAGRLRPMTSVPGGTLGPRLPSVGKDTVDLHCLHAGSCDRSCGAAADGRQCRVHRRDLSRSRSFLLGARRACSPAGVGCGQGPAVAA